MGVGILTQYLDAAPSSVLGMQSLNGIGRLEKARGREDDLQRSARIRTVGTMAQPTIF